MRLFLSRKVSGQLVACDGAPSRSGRGRVWTKTPTRERLDLDQFFAQIAAIPPIQVGAVRPDLDRVKAKTQKILELAGGIWPGGKSSPDCAETNVASEIHSASAAALWRSFMRSF